MKHIKGDHNIITDYLSRPKQKIAQLILPWGSLPLIFMVGPSRSSRSSEPLYMVAMQKRDFPPMPDEVKTRENIHTYTKTFITHFRSQLPEVYFTSLIPR